MNENMVLRIGNTRQSDCETIFSIESLSNIRFPAEYHRKFGKIIFTERTISQYKNWPLILDEIIRCGRYGCQFVFLISLGEKHFSIASFYKQIYLITKGRCSLIDLKAVNKVGGYEITIEVKVDIINVDNNWSFGLIWDGKNKKFLQAFVDSVGNQDTISSIEVIICGPEVELETKLDVKFVSIDDLSERMSNISKKKNLIVSNSSYSNLCIVHNRYTIPSNFISSFESFGLDYDLCIVPQVLVGSGIRTPDWVTQASDFLLTKNYWLSYGEYSPYQYSPGGLTIAKRNVLLENPWNELATWNMAEDVELSQRLRDKGYIYKLNDLSSINVLALRNEIIDDFHYAANNMFISSVDTIIEECNGKCFRLKIRRILRNMYRKLLGA
ncbi:hypothetical protein [Vibrio fluvialis]|uniref:hypothetical protein n=1 Tax=Vibrio fluvialis TaxID=676 RepID=UPI0014049C51|nr:hypothetical protein [Vibrio fluvialis]MBY8246274.1 hypothetical protein [Vibrio fluvialis]NHN74915.1 hypothetical protein [Vibrio fluvialis]